MTKPSRLATILTAVSLLASVTACAGPSPKPRSASIFGGKVDTSNIGIATQAQVALAANNVTEAISLAERAVEKSPRDAGFRALLGNCYLAVGRFASAEAAYKDSLTLIAEQPQVILKLALIEIAQGRNDEAKSLLAQAQGLLDPADVGLALALAGDPRSAVAVLEPAARAIGADSRTRQNLALAYAFSGNWEQARVIASQDVPGDQLDARIQQWMALATPARASDQVAAFIGIQPLASDPGQPVRLALNQENPRQAAAEPIGDASATTVDLPSVAPTPVTEPIPVVATEPAPIPVASAAPIIFIGDPHPALSTTAAPRIAKGKSRAVVQLGAFSSHDRIQLAWDRARSKYSMLRRYTPVSARYHGDKGIFYRLSIKGFASDREARDLCNSLKRGGRACFVRTVSGDAPVQFASR